MGVEIDSPNNVYIMFGFIIIQNAYQTNKQASKPLIIVGLLAYKILFRFIQTFYTIY